MDGLVISVMKMSFRVSKKDFLKNELLEIEIIIDNIKSSAKYLLVSVSNDSLRLLPLKHYFEKESIPKHFVVPCIDLPMSMISDYKKLDKSSLLFLINTRNPHILNAIESFA